jgi:hypothetical protein
MKPEGSLPYSQLPATCPYPVPTPSSPHDPLQLPKHPKNVFRSDVLNEIVSFFESELWILLQQMLYVFLTMIL